MKSKKNDIIGIKVEPLLGLMGAFRYAKDDWGTVAYIIDRSLLENPSINFLQEELQFNSIYFLVGSIGMAEKIYVGQAKKRITGDSVIPRLREHAKSSTEPYRHVWKYAIALTNANDTWGPTELNALEHLFYNLLPQEVVLNGNNPNAGGAIEYAVYEEKVRQIKAYLTAIGLRTFSNTEDAHKIQVIEEKSHGKVEDLHKGLSSIPEIVTPNYVVKQMIDMLPDSVWNDKTVFLDPACKGGEFLRAVFDRLMETDSLKIRYKSDFERAFHILDKQLFGIALSEVSRDRTIRALNGYDKNIKVIQYYIDILKNKTGQVILNGKTATVKAYIAKEFNRVDMNFDVVIGNPPYQETTGGGNNGGKVLYDKFIMLGMDIGDKLCMIVKNNWLNSDSLKEVREAIINKGCIKLMNHSLLGDIFPSLGISASIILTEKGYSGDTEYTELQKGTVLNKYTANLRGLGFVPTSLNELSIVSKMKSTDCFNKHVVGVVPFGISTDGKISQNEFIEEVASKSDAYNIKLVYAKFNTYTNIHCFRKNRALVNQYKVICPKQIHKTSMTVPSVMVLMPGEICSGQYSLLYCSDSYDEAKAVESYIKTRTFRFLVNSLADTLCSFASYRMSLIPNQDFTSSSDIDWSQSISDIDNQLYKKYNLSPEEIAYIEKTIKPMN